MKTGKIRPLSSFAVTHATVLALVVGVFLIDGCAHRQQPSGTPAPVAKEPRS